MYKIYSNYPQNANFGECESLSMAVESVEHYQEIGQCISGCVAVDIENYRIVVARFSHHNWDFDDSNMAFYNRFFDRKEKTKNIQINSYFQRSLSLYHRIKDRFNRIFK